MVIEFPKKYSVRKANGVELYFVTVPPENRNELTNVLGKQAWINRVIPSDDNESFIINLSKAYTITDQQAIDALCRLCEHVMSPVDVA